MQTPTGSGIVQDLNQQRALETLFSLITDVEQRLQIVKASIAQTLPNAALGLDTANTLNPLQAPQVLASLGITPVGRSHLGLHAVLATPYGTVPVVIPTPNATPFGNFRL